MTGGSPDGAGPLSGLARLRNARSKRVSSYDRTGANRDCIVVPAGEKVTIADITGAGCIRHIWSTQASQEEHYLRKIVLRMWWDGEAQPSVECPLGDFFGVGHAVANHFVSLPLNMIRQAGRGTQAGMNCFFPMPFADGARIEDPVHFKKSIRVTIEHGHANNQGNDYSSSAYWYQTEPHKAFPALLPVEQRLPNKRYR